MSKQAETSKQVENVLPDGIKDALRRLGNTVISSNYCGNFTMKNGDQEVLVPRFVVNGTFYVYVFDYVNGIFVYESIEHRNERQREAQERIKYLIEEYDFSWELGKLISMIFPSQTCLCTNICLQIQKARLSIVSNNEFYKWRECFAIAPERTMQKLIRLYGFKHWIDTNNKNVYQALQNYLFAKSEIKMS